ncbi:Site-specific recombinase XerD [Cyclobacterium lianum]|uniref:Site-specific recombinase XerD n=1 Tax=Cyclobacterium lianum TaxID=388280 RepID=A0A1M7PYU5_9BACT|nr:site-specific integrase [Cyclobacterium lianum]SHN22931.1 Site-specific recombinase XerD [Cyclobacterium lianum]
MEASLRYELRRDLENKRGEQPLTLLIHLASQRKKVGTGINLIPELWSGERQQILNLTRRLKIQLQKKYGDNLPNKHTLIQYQDDLIELKNKVRKLEEGYRSRGIAYSVEMLVEGIRDSKKHLTKKEDPSNLIYDFVDRYIQEHELTRVKGSLVVYKSLKKHLKNYEAKTRSKIRFDKIDYNFMQAFQNHLIGWEEVHETTGTVKTLNNITIAKQLSTLKTFLGYAKRQGIKVNDGYKEFSIKKDKLEVIALTQGELDLLFNFNLSSNKRLDQVRDVFCFSCATGFRFSDLQQLKREHIKEMEIRLTIRKTKEPAIVPLNQYSKTILEKYKDLASPIPMISNQKFNKYVKELCKLAGIDDPIEIIRYKGATKQSTIYKKHEIISAHTGRKTFATLSLEKGIPAETVMKITGHADYKSFQRYVKVTEERKRNEMQKAWGAPV